MARKKIPKKVEHLVRNDCKQACANPKCREWATASHELHHIDGDSSNSTVENLILLCGSCHNEVSVGVFSEADVRLWKRMAESGYLPTPSQLLPAGTTIHNHGGVAGTRVTVENLTIKQSRTSKSTPILPGTIGADADMRTYADYLVKRYIEWRKKGVAIDRRPFNPRATHGILGEGFGSLSSVMHVPQSRFAEWVSKTQSKIDRTTWGRNNRYRNYHSYEEHLKQRH